MTKKNSSRRFLPFPHDLHSCLQPVVYISHKCKSRRDRRNLRNEVEQGKNAYLCVCLLLYHTSSTKRCQSNDRAACMCARQENNRYWFRLLFKLCSLCLMQLFINSRPSTLAATTAARVPTSTATLHAPPAPYCCIPGTR